MITQRKKILLVDDTQDLVLVVSRRLESWGYEVLAANTGEEGLRMAQEHRPDLVLLDIMMPKMKGREVCARLKADPKTKHIPVIFLTALGLADHIKAGMEMGAEDYIVKPFEPAELKERITVVLARHDSTAKQES
jgi:DNA-binding response OmpR family regulator